MISLLLLIMLFLALGTMVVMFMAIGYWFIPIIVIAVLSKAIIKALRKLVESIKKSKDDTIIMSRREFNENYQRRTVNPEVIQEAVNNAAWK